MIDLIDVAADWYTAQASVTPKFVHETCHVCQGSGWYGWLSYGQEQQAACHYCAGKGTITREVSE